MNRISKIAVLSVSMSVAVAALAVTGNAADLPKTTVANLKQVKVGPEALDGLDQELAVPQEWVDGAKKEKEVDVLGAWDLDEWARMIAPFNERYPYIKVNYSSSGSFQQRAIAPLVAWKEGHFITDVFFGFGGADPDYIAVGALLKLDQLPTIGKPIDGANEANQYWAAFRLQFWCLAYNTNLVKKSELPATWEDLLNVASLRNGNIGASDRPQLWAMMLRHEWTEEKTKAYLHSFFTTMKPQFRKEGQSAMVELVAAGEFHVALPAAAYTVRDVAAQGAPVAWHCPEPVPLAPSEVGIVSKNPHLNASRIYVNWVLSKEGQLADYAATGAPPSHRDMQKKEFLIYPDETIGKKVMTARMEDKEPMNAMWQAEWTQAGNK